MFEKVKFQNFSLFHTKSVVYFLKWSNLTRKRTFFTFSGPLFCQLVGSKCECALKLEKKIATPENFVENVVVEI